MTASRRHSSKLLLLIALAALAVLVLIPGDVVAQTNNAATGQPIILASAEGAPYLFADTSELRDTDGLPFSDLQGNVGSGVGAAIKFRYSYQWIRIDGGSETNIGDGSARYRLVDADVGKLIKVTVSFTDRKDNPEAVTSLPFGPVARASPLPSPSTLVGNTGQTHSATAVIDKQYAQEFMLGEYGQGYELSSVSIELAAVPSSLTVSLWIGDHSGLSSSPRIKLFDFQNPQSLRVGLNRFTAPAGVLAYHRVRYHIVLTEFGSSLSVKETTSDDEDEGGEAGAELGNDSHLRALDATGHWTGSAERGGVLRLAIEGSRRPGGILGSTYGQPFEGYQEVISIDDDCCFEMGVGPADRYLIRGFSWRSDDTTSRFGGVTNPWHVLDGTSTTAARLFKLVNTRDAAGITEWTAQPGATVAGGSGARYTFGTDWEAYDHIGNGTRTGSALTRIHPATSAGPDRPFSPGVSFSSHGDIAVPADGAALLAVLGEPLYALVQNLGQTDNSYALADSTNPVLSQGFTTGADADGYRLQGIGVNIEGSDDTNSVAQLPDNAMSVAVVVYSADMDGKPDTKLFDLVSPAEFAPGHSFFEAPPGTRLDASTDYVVVWQYNSGAAHRLQRTLGDAEDASEYEGFSIANAFFRGADLSNLSVNSDGNALEIAVYTNASPRTATGLPVILASAEGAPYLFADTSELRDTDGLPFSDLQGNVGSGVGAAIKFRYSYQWIRIDGGSETNIGDGSARYRLVDADVGKLIKVTVSFTDRKDNPEAVTSLPFGPVARASPLPSPSTLVGNTGQTHSATAVIDKQYAQEFMLGEYGQGYELSSVSIELAAVPSSLTVSLWIGDHSGLSSSPRIKLFDFQNPQSLRVGLNRFTAPAGVLAYHRVRYHIVLTEFGSSLSVKETTSDDEDEGGEAGAELGNDSHLRALDATGHWTGSAERGGVLRLAIEGSRRPGGILGSTYGQPFEGYQEVISIDDDCCFEMGVGPADRYLIRGFSWRSDDTTSRFGGVTNPWHVLDGTSTTAARLFKLVNTRDAAGITEWTAQPGATVAGGSGARYTFGTDWEAYDHIGNGTRTGSALTRIHPATSAGPDRPFSPGVSFSSHGDIAVPADGAALLAVLGEPLYALVQNLGQTDNSYALADSTNPVLSQGFTTGADADGYRLQGIGVNIEGSDDTNSVAQLPDNAMSVAVVVYSADMDGKPDTKLFDLVSPAEFAPGHSFFEAPPGTRLDASTDYVVVWQYNSGAAHRLQRTLGDAEDASEYEGFSIANAFFRGADLSNLSVNSDGNALEIAVYTNASPRTATGLPVILASAEGAPYLFADTSELRDTDGLPFSDLQGNVGSGVGAAIKFRYSYQWIRIDGGSETNIGDGSARYRLVDADVGKLIKVTVSFTDRKDNPEAVTSLPFGPVARASPLPSPSTLVGNTGQTHSATAVIDKQYAQEFMLGEYGQGYELSSVSVELAAVPSSLTVSLWIGDHSGLSSSPRIKLFDFQNPQSLRVGLNRFTAPAGVLAYHRVRYHIVLTEFGSSLSVKETTSDDEDEGGEAGAELGNDSHLRALDATGHWTGSAERGGVLRLAIEGSRRPGGILGSTYGQPFEGYQEVISIDDDCCFEMGVGPADRYLIRGFSWRSDDTTSRFGGVTNPWHVLDGTSTTAARLFKLVNTRDAAGITEWTAQPGATVAGGSGARYTFGTDWEAYDHIGNGTRTGSALTRIHPATSAGPDRPFSPGVSFSSHGDIAVPADGAALLAVLGEPLYAMAQNLGQTDNGYIEVGGAGGNAVTQGFQTGSETGGYGLQGIGFNIEGSDDTLGNAQIPEDSSSVTVSLHAFDTGGIPGAKLFDLVSPAEFAPGHSFFEAPPGTRLDATTNYVVVWRHQAGAAHRLQQTTADAEDAGAFVGALIADAFFLTTLGGNTIAFDKDSGGNSLEIAVYTDTTPRNASGLPVVLVSAEGGSILAADTSRIADADGLPHIGRPDSGIEGYAFSYQWIRVDDETETEVGSDSQRYQLVDADIGKLIKARVSFVDRASFPEAVTSLPYGPVPRRELSAAPRTLVGNTGQTPSAAADISGTYAIGFSLGKHGQGYEISSVEIDLAAVPSSLSVSLWSGRPRRGDSEGLRIAKLFDFSNPSSFQVGLNKFRAPAGAFAYQSLNYWIVLSGFGDSLSINETTSDDEDAGGETGATICNFSGNEYVVNEGEVNEMYVSCNDVPDGDSSVVRLAVKGSMRTSGILAANYAQSIEGDQEVVSIGDKIGFGIVVGTADRYLVRGVSFASDDTTSRGAGFINPFWLRSDSLTGDRHFDLVNTRDVAGQGVWTAPQGATVAGGCTTQTVMMVEEVTCNQYVFDWADINVKKQNDVDRIGAVLSRFIQVADADDGRADPPTEPGVSLESGQFLGDDSDYGGNTPLMAVHGEALVAMVQNLGQTDNSYVEVGGASAKVLSQAFTTGSDALYRLQGVGVNIEGSDNTDGDAQLPDDSASVSVSVYTIGIGGTPETKLFDLVSPTEYAAGHSFFEAPPGTYLFPSTSYVLVWRHLGGTLHRLQKTASDSEDTGAATGAGISDVFWLGSQTDSGFSLAKDANNNVLEIAVYTEVIETAPYVPGGIEVPLSWLHMPDGVEVGYQFRTLFVTHRGRLPTSANIEDYNDFVQWEAAQKYSDPVIRNNSSEFKALVCTTDDDARTNTGMHDPIGVPIHWLDGGWDDHPTLVAKTYLEFYGSEWVNSDYGAYVTGNSAHFEEHAMVLTGCNAYGAAHSTFFMGNTSLTYMVAVGTPNGRTLKTRENSANSNFAPLGAVDPSLGYPYHEYFVVVDGQKRKRLLPLYGISPVFTVVTDPEDE